MAPQLATINNDFIFRCALKTIGKYIDASGLDQSFIEGYIYGPTTIEQVKSDKDMYQSFEAFLVLYISLHS